MTLSTSPTGTAHSPTVATISLSALAHNLQETRRVVPPTCGILAVVKADAYGHGGIVISQFLSRLGIRRFGVATIQEGITLREAGIQEEILILGGQFSWQLQDMVHFRLTPVISNLKIVDHLLPLVQAFPHPYPVHIKIDTGMARLGLEPQSVSTLVQGSHFSKYFQLQGLMTHLADGDNEDPTYTNQQLQDFLNLVQHLKEGGLSIPLLSVANTAGILFHPKSHLDMVRPGLMLFGYPPVEGRPVAAHLKPVMRLSTRIVQVRTVGPNQPVSYNGIFRTKKTSRIGILPIGYAHGYSRRLSNKGAVLVGNKRAPIVGRICMDMMLIDITETPEVQQDDEVILLGTQADQRISAMDLAQWQETAPYEILCNLGPRVNRVYENLNEYETA